jgi:putative oxidoreductase
VSEHRSAGRSFAARWAPLPLRLIVGYGFMAHGFAKLSRGPDVFAGALHGLGVPVPHVMSWLTIAIELIGGALVLAGAFVQIASIPLAVVLLVAIITVHWQYGFSSIKLVAVTDAGPQFGPPGVEVALIYVACLVTLVMGGAGPMSVDASRAASRRGEYLPTLEPSDSLNDSSLRKQERT